MLVGCKGTEALPEKAPEEVAKQFYEYISEAKLRGAAIPAKAAFKLIDAETSNLDERQFIEIVKRYPPGFMVEVGKAKIKGTQAVVAISYQMPSSFGGTYAVKGELPLNVDKATHTWKIDFTGDTYGMQKEDFLAAARKKSQ